MNLTPSERLITLMLCDLHRHLNTDFGWKLDLIQGAITTGNLWALDEELHGLVAVETTDEALADEAGRIMSMWRAIEWTYDALSEDEQAEVKEAVGALASDTRFPGFDGNHEGRHLSVANMYVETMGRFKEWAGRDLNSHSMTLQFHRPMLRVIGPLLSSGGGHLTKDQLIEVLRAKLG